MNMQHEWEQHDQLGIAMSFNLFLSYIWDRNTSNYILYIIYIPYMIYYIYTIYYILYIYHILYIKLYIWIPSKNSGQFWYDLLITAIHLSTDKIAFPSISHIVDRRYQAKLQKKRNENFKNFKGTIVAPPHPPPPHPRGTNPLISLP